MISVVIHHDDVAARTEAASLIAEAVMARAQDNQLGFNGALVHPTDSVFYAESKDAGDVVGVLVYRKGIGAAICIMLYVEPTSRRNGIARKLWTAFFKCAQECDLDATAVIPYGDKRALDVARIFDLSSTALVLEA